MISNTELFYIRTKRFQDKRAELTKKYESEVKSMERFQGSLGYDEDLKKLRDNYEADLSALVESSKKELFPVLGYMMDAIGKRSVAAPTAEQVNLLSVLKMKKKVTLEECQRAAAAVKDNPICISVLDEIAHEHGYLQRFDSMCSEMSSQRASELVKMMKSGLEDFIQYDTTKTSRLANAFHEAHYGAPDKALMSRVLFADKEGCFREICGMDGNTLSLFSAIVDAEGGGDDAD